MRPRRLPHTPPSASIPSLAGPRSRLTHTSPSNRPSDSRVPKKRVQLGKRLRETAPQIPGYLLEESLQPAWALMSYHLRDGSMRALYGGPRMGRRGPILRIRTTLALRGFVWVAASAKTPTWQRRSRRACFSYQARDGHRGGAAGTPWRLGCSCHPTQLASQLASQQCTQMPQNGSERPFSPICVHSCVTTAARATGRGHRSHDIDGPMAFVMPGCSDLRPTPPGR